MNSGMRQPFFFQFLTIPGRIKDRFNADLMVFDEVYVFL